MIYALIASVLVSFVSLIGASLLFKKNFINSKYGGLLVSMAAGVMLATAVLDLLPEAVELYHEKELFWALLAGIGLFFVFERFLHWYHHHEHESDHHHLIKGHPKPAAYLILLGDGLHNFFDGLAIAAAFNVSFELGMITTLAVILHEIPQELADFVAILHSGFKFWRALLYNLISGLAAVFGVLIGWYFVNSVEGALPFLLAFNAGMFIYISCSDLIPALHEDFKRDRKWAQTITFVLGILLMAILINYLHPEHQSEDEEEIISIEIQRPLSESHLESENAF